MTTSRRKRLQQVLELVHSTKTRLTKDELRFMKQHGYKQQTFMFVHTEADRQKAKDLLNKLEDKDTLVMLVSKEDRKL